MTTKNYFILCAALSAVTSLLVLYVPPVARAIELGLLLFLSTNAG